MFTKHVAKSEFDTFLWLLGSCVCIITCLCLLFQTNNSPRWKSSVDCLHQSVSVSVTALWHFSAWSYLLLGHFRTFNARGSCKAERRALYAIKKISDKYFYKINRFTRQNSFTLSKRYCFRVFLILQYEDEHTFCLSFPLVCLISDVSFLIYAISISHTTFLLQLKYTSKNQRK